MNVKVVNNHMEYVATHGTDECVFKAPETQVEETVKLKSQKNEEWTDVTWIATTSVEKFFPY